MFEIPIVPCHSNLFTEIFKPAPKEKNKEINCMT